MKLKLKLRQFLFLQLLSILNTTDRRLMMSLLIPPSDTVLTDASDGNESDYSHTQGTHNDMDKIRQIMIQTEGNLKILLNVDDDTFDRLINQLQLDLLRQMKQAIQALKQQPQSTKIDKNNNIDNKSPFTIAIANTTSMEETDDQPGPNTLLNVNTLIGNVDHDAVSIVSGVTGVTGITGITGITGVSSIAPSIAMDDPLIVMMGISEYEGMANLAGIPRDYDNFINTFVTYWKYKIFYRLSDNTCIYTNDKNELKTDYKLKWNGDEIEQFIEESRKCIVKNKHNGLLFAISSHGDSGRILYDSEGELFELDSIFSMYSPQAAQLLTTYKETREESLIYNTKDIFFRYVSW